MAGEVDEALARIAAGENQETEFKREFPGQARDLAEVIAGFATCNEGRVYLGVDNSGNVIGLACESDMSEPAWRDAIQKRILGIVYTVEPRIRVEVSFHKVSGKTLCEVFVPKGVEPVYYVGSIPYLRDLGETRKASPGEVKAFHRRLFQAEGPAGRKSGEGVANLLSQLSDLDVLLSDVDQRIGDDLRQWRYDLEATAQALRNLSTVRGIAAIGADREALILANAVEGLSSYRLYMDGGVSWKALLDEVKKVREAASALTKRIAKNMAFDPSEAPEIKRITVQQLQLIEDLWNHRADYLARGRMAAMRAQLRHSAMVFSRLSKLLQIADEKELSALTAHIGESFRTMDNDKVFRPGIGQSPVELMEGTFEGVLADARCVRVLVAGTP